jgi:hypothetical protein
MNLLESFLKGMQVIHGSQTFDSENLVTVSLHGKHQAGPDWFSVEQNRTRAAHAVLAADVCAGQAKLMAQEIAEQQTRLHGSFVLSAVNGN